MNIFEIAEQYFCCPICKGKLKIKRIGNTADGVIECAECQHRYLVVDNICLMLPFTHVESRIKEQFFERHSNCRTLFEDIVTGIDDNVKQHQIETWNAQYREAIELFSFSKAIPYTEKGVHSIFYENSRKLLDAMVLNKRKTGDNEVFLEIGCGGGALTHLAMRNFKLYFGMDISFNAILQCYLKFPFGNAVFFVGDAESIPLKDASVNVCAAQWLFEHLTNPKNCVDEIFRVLSKGGSVYVDTNHKKFLFTYRWYQMVLTPKHYWRRMEEAGHSHDRFFGRNQLQDIFKQANFTRISTKLCYFLLDMLVANKVMPPMLRAVLKYTGQPTEKRGSSTRKDRHELINNKLPRKARIHTLPLSLRKDYLIKTFNFFMKVLHYLLFIDRALERWGKGESVILVARKEIVCHTRK